ARGPARTARPHLPLHSARSFGGAPSLPSRRRHVSRPDRRDGADRRDLRQSSAPLHAGAARLGPGTGSGRRGRARDPPGHGRGAESDQPAVRLRLPSALSHRGRGLQIGAAGTAGGAAGSFRGLQRSRLKSIAPSTTTNGRRATMRTKAALATALGAALRAALAAGPADAAETPERGGTLIYMIPADGPPSFDGHRETTFATTHATAPFYSVLVRVNPDNPSSTTEFVCDLCTEMPKPTNGGKTYTFKIREG